MLYVEVTYHFNEYKLISKFLQNYFGINLGLKGLSDDESKNNDIEEGKGNNWIQG